MAKIRVLIVDDSPLFRKLLQDNLNKTNDIEVVGTANDASQAENQIKLLKPDVITLDNEMPKMSGIDFLKHFIPQNPIPTIVVTASPISAFDAIDAGAVDFIKKPNASEFSAFMQDIIGKIKIAKISRVRKPLTKPIAQPMSLTNLNSKKIIAIGASTGGTEAIIEVVKNLPPTTPGIVIVQHMPPVFTNMYAQRLNKICKMSAKEAEDGDRIERGKIIVGAGEFHLTVKKDAQGYYVKSQRGEKVSGHCPSVDVLFDSVATTVGRDAIGVILTGMGQDGAKGMLKMKQNGAYTIGQNQETCVVYGMPMVAYNIGGVVKQAPLEKIGSEIISYINTNR